MEIIHCPSVPQRPLFASEIELRLLAKKYKHCQATPPDVELCAESRCQTCGTRGLAAVGFEKGASYRVVAVCGFCRAAEEV